MIRSGCGVVEAVAAPGKKIQQQQELYDPFRPICCMLHVAGDVSGRRGESHALSFPQVSS